MICKSPAFEALVLTATLWAAAWAQGTATKTLDIRVVDGEGGKAALYVTLQFLTESASGRREAGGV